MLSELPKIFGRDFIIGSFLPAAIFVAASLALRSASDLSIPLSLQGDTILRDATVFGFVSWLGGILILATNRNILRVLAGYGRFNPLNLVKGVEKSRFERLHKNKDKLDKWHRRRLGIGKHLPSKLQDVRIQLTIQTVDEFPADESNLLPTSFGNTISAFEDYPRIMYGLDPIKAWNRLLAVISKEFLESINSAKAQVDFWANLSFLSVIVVLECLVVINHGLRVFGLMIGAGIVSYLSLRMAKIAAVEWGELVKSSFDVFLPDLRKKLEFAFRANKTHEQQDWSQFSQAISYRLPQSMPGRVRQPGSRTRTEN
jgi:hypothetical protein